MQRFTQATVAEYSAPGRRGLSFGYVYLGVFGVGALGSSAAGAALTYGSRTAFFLLVAGFAVAGLALALVLRK